MTTATTSEARISLSKKLAEFRERGISSAPLIFGDHRKPEAVVLPFELYSQLEEAIDQLHFDSATQVMDRIETVIAHPSLAVEVVRQKNKHI